MQELFDGVLHLLEYTGLDVHHDEARDILEKAGAWVDGLRVRIPSYLVKKIARIWRRAASPSSPVMAIRTTTSISAPAGPILAPDRPVPISSTSKPWSGGPTSRSDVPLVAKVVDALPNIDFCESLGTVNDVHHQLGALYEFAGMFPNTSKPIVAWSYDRFDSAGIHEIAVAEAGGQEAFERRPNYVHYCEPLSPLVSTFEAMDKLIFAARHRVPLIFTPCPIAGGTAPVTAAGIIIQGAAESWMGLVLAQAIAARIALLHGRRLLGDGHELDDPGIRRPGTGPDDGRDDRVGAFRRLAALANRWLHRFQDPGRAGDYRRLAVGLLFRPDWR